MKYFLTSIALMASVCYCTGQSVLATNYSISTEPSNPDAIVAHITTGFSFGFGPTCPDVTSWKTDQHLDTLFLRAMYDVSGAWPLVGCQSTDSLNNVSLLPGIHYVNISTNTINSLSPTETDTTWMIYDSTFILQSAGLLHPELPLTNLKLWPNPATRSLHIELPVTATAYTLYCYNVAGEIVFSKVVSHLDKLDIDVSLLPMGLYYLKAVSRIGTHIGIFEKGNE